jgi:hypothetical protein
MVKYYCKYALVRRVYIYIYIKKIIIKQKIWINAFSLLKPPLIYTLPHKLPRHIQLS